MLVEIALRGVGTNVFSERITDGDAAVRQIREAANSGIYPDVIVMDIHLPRVDGVGVARVIQATPEFRGTKIIAISSFVNPVTRDELLSLGVSRVVDKPADLRAFRQVIQDAVRDFTKQ